MEVLGRYFEVPSVEKFQSRTWELILTAPKVFLGAFLWEGFGLACGCNMDSSDFYFMTGFGSALGTFFGQLLVGAIRHCAKFDLMHELFQAVIYGLPIFLGPGTAWQKIVNDCQDWGFSFDESFCYMWLVSFLILICSLTFLRIIHQALVTQFKIVDDIEPFTARFFFDLQVSMSIGFGDAFFMGTVPEQFSHNFLAPAFGVYSNTPPFEGMLKAGASTLCGFLIMQFFQNLFIKDSWLDSAPKNLDDTAGALSDNKIYDYGADRAKADGANENRVSEHRNSNRNTNVMEEQQNELVNVSSAT